MADPPRSAIFLWRTPPAAGTSQDRCASDLAGLDGMRPLSADAELETVDAWRGHVVAREDAPRDAAMRAGFRRHRQVARRQPRLDRAHPVRRDPAGKVPGELARLQARCAPGSSSPRPERGSRSRLRYCPRPRRSVAAAAGPPAARPPLRRRPTRASARPAAVRGGGEPELTSAWRGALGRRCAPASAAKPWRRSADCGDEDKLSQAHGRSECAEGRPESASSLMPLPTARRAVFACSSSSASQGGRAFPWRRSPVRA